MKVITIGRSSDNDVVISDSRASRHHLQIIQDDKGNFRLSDFGSTNGTFVNGQRIAGEIKLNWNDSVQVGDTRLQWQQYFNPSGKKDHTLGLVIGLVGGVTAIVLILILALSGVFESGNNSDECEPSESNVRTNVPNTGDHKNSDANIQVNIPDINVQINIPETDDHKKITNGIHLDFSMSLHEIRKENPNVRMKRKECRTIATKLLPRKVMIII